MSTLKFEDVDMGYGLNPIKENITQDSINAYAEASGDFNPIHVDPEWAEKNGPFGGTVAHGLTSIGFVSRLISDNFGEAWYYSGHIDVAFKKPVKPGDTVLSKAKVVGKKEEGDKNILELRVFCENQNRGTIISGTVAIVL